MLVVPNQLVEVCGDDEEGFVGSWCPAFVVGESERGKVLVQYLEFVDEEHGQPLREAVAARRVRPAPPPELARFKCMKEVKLADSVEAYQDDCWWQGAVVGLATAGVQVNLFDSDSDVIFVRDPAHLRPRAELSRGAWRRVAPKRSELKGLGLAGKDVDAALRALEAARPVPAGPPRLRAGSDGGAAAAAPKVQPPPAGKTLAAQTGHVERPRGSPWKARRSTGVRASEGPADAADGGASGSDPAAAGAAGLGTKLTAVAGEAAAAGAEAAARPQASLKRRREACAGADDSGAESGAEAEDQLCQSGGTAGAGAGGGGCGGDAEGYGQQEGHAQERAAGDAGPGPSSRAAAAAAAAAAVPRPRREGKSRLVYVDGHPVLKENMYGLHDEDTMVWQRGLQTGAAVLEGVALQPPAPRARPSPSRPKLPPGPRQHPPEYLARQEHNNAIRRDMQACEVGRARYLAQHLDKLRPFITQQVEARIQAIAAGPAPPSKPPVPVTQQPEEILALEGLSWMAAQFERGVNAILADEMGLGKTLQTITFLAHLKFVRHVEGPHLVVVPLSVMSSWMSEFKRWCPRLRVVRLHSTDTEERKRLVREVLGNPASFDVAVTTYDMINSQHFGNSLKHAVVWRYLVLDEGHKVLMLTGTPIQNNLHELYALLSFMYPDVFTDPSRFDAAFNLTKSKVDRAQLEAAHYLLRPFMLRRLKEEVEVALPPRLETRIACPLAAMQTFWYRRMLLRDGALLGQLEATEEGAGAAPAGGAGAGPSSAAGASTSGPSTSGSAASGSASWKKAMNLLMQLRKVCNHPFMFPDAEPDFDGETAPAELITGSGESRFPSLRWGRSRFLAPS
ncbi:hypothetical protein GPECTOR_5g179 [Gonium pectorale]|uniref:Helicase ATP-binding domain-containing protein n=1 Tax=Gonium pectorale TaxID=33097 RepID=A0A150GWJ2_GONPE|nr:hypothetical protein GPECTOR_5g179 [Gonium pectorale]|eukprot:KXZ54072.1 hypothetical protein GPECTOR_5g179 [Gonium pectorale]